MSDNFKPTFTSKESLAEQEFDEDIAYSSEGSGMELPNTGTKMKQEASADSRGSVQDYNFTPSKEREGAHRDLPTSERIKNFMIDYRNSVIFLVVMSLVLVFMGAFSAVDDFTWKSYVTMELTCVALVLMLNNQPPDLVMTLISILLLLMKIVTTDEAIAGFSSSSVLAIGVLFVVAKGLEEAGTVELLLTSVLGNPTNVTVAILRLSLPVAIVSSCMNNTPVVAMMIPVIEGWSQRTGIPASKLLIPLSFSSMLGGMCTLLGTSTNLVLQDLAASATNPYEIGMFTMAPVGAPLMASGILFMAFFHCLLPDNSESGKSNSAEKRNYSCTFICTAAANGKKLQAIGLLSVPGASFVGVDRDVDPRALLPSVDGEPLKSVDANDPDVLKKGYKIEFQCTADAIPRLRKFREVKIDKDDELSMLGGGRRHRRLFEVSLDQGSPLVGEPVDSIVALSYYNAVIISHRSIGQATRTRAGTSLASQAIQEEKHGDEEQGDAGSSKRASSNPAAFGDTMLKVGDTLVIESFTSFLGTYSTSGHFSVVRELAHSFAPRFETMKDQIRVVVAGIVLVLMVSLAAADVYNIFVTSCAASFLLVAAQCLTIEQAFAAIKGRVVLAIVATYGLGAALSSTGVADVLAAVLVALGKETGNIGLLAILYFTTSVLSCIVSNQATVILLWPVVQQIDIDGLEIGHFALALMMGASTAFATPIGYQTNLMVYGPGRYSFSDFIKIGGTMTLVLTALAGPLVYILT